jgi:hypothetical protein
MRPISLATLLTISGMCGFAEGAEPRCLWWLRPRTEAPSISASCPDDYCSKPLPPIPCVACRSLPNDYCAKPLPIVCPVKCFGCNDYCPKCLPAVMPGCAAR